MKDNKTRAEALRKLDMYTKQGDRVHVEIAASVRKVPALTIVALRDAIDHFELLHRKDDYEYRRRDELHKRFELLHREER